MYLSLNWLKDYVEIPKSITPEELGLKLTLHTVEIDGIEKQSEKFKNIVVGKILEIKKHPNADRLQLALVDVKKEKLNIVCGAFNIEAGQLVPVALVGAILPNGLKIKEAEVRGEKSEGMLCAPDELGLGDNHAGIMILGKKAKLGQYLGEYLKLGDIVYEVDNKSITNRPDLWSHYGMAREISTFLNVKMLHNFKENFVKKLEKDLNKINVKVEDHKLCSRYMAIKLDGIEIKESSKFIQNRLIAVGMRPINNIVDITNYVMLELGQPMHAFDASLIGENIIIRNAKNGEMIETLDGEKRELNKKMLVIANKKEPVAIAGVMGGLISEVNNQTKSIVLESANFNAVSIRKTSQKLGLRSEASQRFEKSLDPNLCEIAIIRAIELIKESCPKSKIASYMVDKKKFTLNQGPIYLDLNWVREYIGAIIESKKIIKILENLGFGIEKINNEDVVKVNVPTWRATKDISIKEDLVEEVVRIYGYDNLKTAMPKVEMQTPEINKKRALERKIKEILSKSGKLNEVYNYSFVGEELLKKIKINYSSHIRLANPINNIHTMLRQSLIPNLLDNIRFNQSRFNQIGIFEIGSVFYDLPSSINKDNKNKESLPFQEKRLAIMVSKNDENVLNKLKGQLEDLIRNFNLDIFYEKKDDLMGWEDINSLTKIIINDQEIGFLALVDNKVLNNIGIKTKVGVLEINFDLLYKIMSNKSQKKYNNIPKYPSAVRDLAFVVRDKILYNDIKNEIKGFDSLIKSIELFDVYQDNKLGKDKKNLAFHIVYQALDRTLVNEEVDQIQNKLVKHLEKKYEAQVRDF